MTRARAPGKALLAGEYAVLEGATAIVAAIARHAIADTAGPPSDRPEVVRVARALGAAPPAVEVGAFAVAGRKLGLGSSAAAAVAAAGAIRADRGDDLADAGTRAALLPLVVAEHRAAQGGVGSGADVAAALYGGIVSVEPGPPLRVRPAPIGGGIALVLADAGEGARTAPLARAALEHGLPAPLREAAPALAEALARGGLESIGRAAALHLRGLQELGRLVGRALVSDGFRAIEHEARALGGVAKPSGAGGGELTVVFVSADRADALAARLRSGGRWAECAAIDPEGVRVVAG